MADDGGGSDGGGGDAGSNSGGGYGGGGDAGSNSGGGYGGGDAGSSSGGGYGGGDAGSSSGGGYGGGSDGGVGGSGDSGGSDGGVGGSNSGGSDDGGSDSTPSGTPDEESSGTAPASDPAGTDVGINAGGNAGTNPGTDSGTDQGTPAESPGDAASNVSTGTSTSVSPSGTDPTGTDLTGTDLTGTDLTGTDSATSGIGSGFTVSTTGLSDVNSTFGGLVSDGQDLVSGLGSLSLSPSIFGGIGSPVADAAQGLSDGQLSALGNTFSVLGSVNDGIGFSNAGYLDADQQVSTSLGGILDPTTSTSPYGSLPDAATFATPPSLPTFATLPDAEAQAVDTLNAQALQQQTPASLADDPTMQAQLVQHEAAKTHVYTDTAGHPTVGIGFNLDRSGARDAITAVGADYDAVRAGTQDLTDDQVTQLAHTDTEHAVDVARNYFSGFDSLDPARQRALVDMSFNLDNKMNQFTGLHQALVNGDYDAAANHISSSLFARQTGIRGTDLANQMRNGGQ